MIDESLQVRYWNIDLLEELSQAMKDLESKNQELQEANRNLEKATEFARNCATEAEKANKTKSEFLANMSHYEFESILCREIIKVLHLFPGISKRRAYHL